MATLFEAYVTNAGKYSDGQLVGETLKFPTTAQEVEALLKRMPKSRMHLRLKLQSWKRLLPAMSRARNPQRNL